MGVVAQTIFNVAACWWRTICIRWSDGFSSDIGNRYSTFFRKGDGPGLCIDRCIRLFIKIKPQQAYKDYTSKKPEATTQHLHT
jgi:hypothetical protein